MTGTSLGSLRLKVVDGIVTEIPRFNNEFLGKDRVLKSPTFFILTIPKI
jgi:hypothetical protein